MPRPSAYVICAPRRAELLDLGGLPDAPRHVDPWRVASAVFIRLVNGLHGAHAPCDALRIPAWALYDCAESSGFVAGLESVDGHDPTPLTLLAATPGMTEGDWHCLAFRGQSDLMNETLGLALALARPVRMTGVVRWADPLLGVLVAGRRLEILTAWTPAHSDPASATYRIAAQRTGESAQTSERVCFRPDDAVAMRRVQGEIERGRRAWVVGAPGDGSAEVEIGS